ncbi:MAG: hypothetical protein A2516_01335 [Alphaproteobacteria bacterium RIFOXYD12_FULL_60_8]|nr:MAG: hypothetical protein A2516_01335 [Alphaproteobacteria bacterium RIFOXYD12_FULL_60_8]
MPELENKATYFQKQAEQMAARLVQADATTFALRHELEQKRRGFSLLSNLTDAIGAKTDRDAFRNVALQINGTLNMQRTVVLKRRELGGFGVVVCQGYEREAEHALAELSLPIPSEMLDPTAPLLLTKESPPETLAEVRQALGLPFLISVPIVVNGQVEAVLVTGRIRQQQPFMPRLDNGDVETVQSIAAFLAAILTRERLMEVEHLANHDPLTGLPNLRLGLDRLGMAINEAKREDNQAALLFIDLDGFKKVNDMMGHESGDAVLREVARRLESCVREMDTVARIGGDEFVVILPALKDRQGAARVAEEILANFSLPMECIDGKYPIGASVGIALFPDHAQAAPDLLKAADEAMYGIKKNGKNNFGFVG